MSKQSSGVRTLSVTVRVQIDADDPDFVEAQRLIGPGTTARRAIASEILSNLESVGYVRWARIARVGGPEESVAVNEQFKRRL
jgi:carbamate kinase